MAPRKKLELLGLIERVHSLYHNDKMQLKAIAKKLEKEGVSVSTSTLHRAINSHEETVEKFKIASLECREILAAAGSNGSDTDFLEASLVLLKKKVMTAINNLPDLSKVSGEKLTDMVESLCRSQLIKQKMEQDIPSASFRLKSEFTKLLMEEHADVLVKVIDVIEQAEDNLKKGKA